MLNSKKGSKKGVLKKIIHSLKVKTGFIQKDLNKLEKTLEEEKNGRRKL